MMPAVGVEATTFTVRFDHLYDDNEGLADWFSLTVAKSALPVPLYAEDEAPVWCVLRRANSTHPKYLCRDNVFRRDVGDYDRFYLRTPWPGWNRWRRDRYEKLEAQFRYDRFMTQHQALTLAVQYLPRLTLMGHPFTDYLEGGCRAPH